MAKRDFDKISVYGDSVLSEKQTLAWKICNFADLEHKRGEKIEGIGSLPCHGSSWSLRIYPRGHALSSEDHDFVSIYLKRDGSKEEKVQFSVFVKDYGKDDRLVFKPGPDYWGWHEFRKRDDVITALDDEGNLLIKVDIQLYLDKTEYIHPRGTLSEDMLKMLDSGKGSDVTFVVQGKRFHAHYGILAFRAPTLADLAEDNKNEEEIALDGVGAEMFDALLRSVYGEEAPPAELLEVNTRDMLDMADRFGCTNLKLLAESKLVESGISNDNAAELLVFADAKNCAFFKEAALSHMKANTSSVMQSVGWTNVKKSARLLSEFMETSFSKSSPASDNDDVDCMTVAALRRELQKKRLSEDGTRKMLVERLKEDSAKKRRTET